MTSYLKAIIVDDEEDAIKFLKAQLSRADIQVDIQATFTLPSKALAFDGWEGIDVLFIDMEMPEMNGFRFLDALGPIKPQIVFTTAHEEYAIGAIKRGALDYLLKPVSLAELNSALQLVSKESKNGDPDKPAFDRLCVPTQQGFEIIDLSKLIWLESSSNYTYLHIQGINQPFLISKTLGSFAKKLSDAQFARVNQSNIVNLTMVRTYDKRNGSSIFLENGKEFNVSPVYKERFLKQFKDKMLK